MQGERGRKRLTPLGIVVLYAAMSLVGALIYPYNVHTNGFGSSATRYKVVTLLALWIPILITVVCAWRMGRWYAISLPFIAVPIGMVVLAVGARHTNNSGLLAGAYFVILLGSALAGYLLHLFVDKFWE